VEWSNTYADFIPNRDYAMDPVLDLLYPIVNDLNRVAVAGSEDYDPTQHEIVGLLGAPFYWRHLIQGSLPLVSNGVVV
jgi:hypothetical protein